MDNATLARYTSLSESMIRKLAQDPADPLSSFLVGRSRRFYKPTVDAWMARRMAALTAVDTVLHEIRSARSR
jgi:hypothetical protein